MRIQVGMQVFPGAPAAIVREAQRCEELGFDSVWVADHFHGAGRDNSWVVPELFSLLGALAATTSSITIGSCVASMLKRDPGIVAQAALTLNHISNGRLKLGIGAGFGPDLRAFGVDVGQPATRVEEALIVLRGLMASSPQAPFSFQGRWNNLSDAFLNFPRVSPPPILVAAIGPRMLTLTRERADGWLPFGLTPELYAEFLDEASGARDNFDAGLWLPTFIEKPGEDRSEEAEATGRLYLSMAPSIVQRLLGGDAAHVASSSSWSPEAAQETAQKIPADVARSVTLCGSPDECADTLSKFIAAGCRHFVLRITDAKRRQEDAAFFAQAVLGDLMT